MENEIDFVDIVLYGYFHKRKALGNYFYRQFKAAEAKHYGLVEFFSACKEVALQFQENITKQVRDRRFEIHDVLVAAENGTLGVTITDGKTKEECIAEAVRYWQEEFDLGFGDDWAGSVKNYHVHLLSYTYGKHRGMLYWNDILEIIKGLYDAIQLYKAENDADKKSKNPEQVQPQVTKADILREQLVEHGFFELSALTEISEEGRVALIRKLSSEEVPYKVAMFDHLGYIEYLKKEKCDHKYEQTYKLLGKIIDKGADGIKKNFLALNSRSKINRNRYTAHIYKEIVKSDIQLLRLGVPPA